MRTFAKLAPLFILALATVPMINAMEPAHEPTVAAAPAAADYALFVPRVYTIHVKSARFMEDFIRRIGRAAYLVLYECNVISVIDGEVFEQMAAQARRGQPFWRIEHMDCSDTLIRTLPEQIGLLQSLRAICLRNSQIEELPDALDELHNLELVEVDQTPFAENQERFNAFLDRHPRFHFILLSFLPKHGHISSYSQLNYMYFDYFNGDRTPGSHGTFDLHGNRFNDRIRIKSIAGAVFTQMAHLASRRDWLERLKDKLSFEEESISHDMRQRHLSHPTRMRGLDLADNHIEAIPEEIGLLTNLTGIDISDNPIHAVPESLLRLPHLRHLWLDGTHCTQETIDHIRAAYPALEVRADRLHTS